MKSWTDIDASSLLEKLKQGDIKPEQIIDVREPVEWVYYHLPETLHIPMNSIPERMEELPQDRDLYILCAHGVRSSHVCRYLSEQGYGSLRNISGGIASIALLNGFQYD